MVVNEQELDDVLAIIAERDRYAAALEHIAYPEYGIGFRGLKSLAKRALYGDGKGRPTPNKESQP